MQTWVYPALVEGSPGDWTVTIPAFPEVVTGHADRGQALYQAEDALGEAVLGRLSAGEAIPAPPAGGDLDGVGVPLDPVTAARVALAHAMAEGNVSASELARRLNRTEGAVRRLTAGTAGVKLDTVREALAVLGRRTALVVQD